MSSAKGEAATYVTVTDVGGNKTNKCVADVKLNTSQLKFVGPKCVWFVSCSRYYYYYYIHLLVLVIVG